MVQRERENYLIQSVCHSLDVIDELSKAKSELGVTELAKKLSLHKNNVFRILSTLCTYGYVEQNPMTENYILGPACLKIGQSYLLQSDVITRVRPLILELAKKTGETVSFAKMIDMSVYYPISICSKQSVAVAQRLGNSLLATECASGWAGMSSLTNEKLQQDFPNCSTELLKRITEIKAKGWYIDNGKHEKDVVCMVSTVYGLANSFIGVVEILAPKYRADEGLLKRELLVTTEKISNLFASGEKTLSSKIEKELSNCEGLEVKDSKNMTSVGSIR